MKLIWESFGSLFLNESLLYNTQPWGHMNRRRGRERLDSFPSQSYLQKLVETTCTIQTYWSPKKIPRKKIPTLSCVFWVWLKYSLHFNNISFYPLPALRDPISLKKGIFLAHPLFKSEVDHTVFSEGELYQTLPENIQEERCVFYFVFKIKRPSDWVLSLVFINVAGIYSGLVLEATVRAFVTLWSKRRLSSWWSKLTWK